MNIIAPIEAIQADRVLRLESSLGADVLLPERMEVREGVLGLFEIVVWVRSKLLGLKANEIIGQLVDVSLQLGDQERRPWNGLVTDFLEGPMISRELRSDRLTLRPQLWLLSQRSDCRIWQQMSSLDVLDTLFSEHRINKAQRSIITLPPPVREYSVQWNETDLAYLKRRLEEDGIFYWFEHQAGQHTMHVSNHHSGYTRGPDTDVRLAAGSTDRNHITKFQSNFSFIPGQCAGADWNFQSPRTAPAGHAPSLVSLSRNQPCEFYQYPSRSR